MGKPTGFMEYKREKGKKKPLSNVLKIGMNMLPS